MESGRAFSSDESRAYDLDHDRGGRYAPGPIDEIGDRILILDERGTPTSELLCFRQTLTTSAGFEVALRRRVERLRHFRHAAFTTAPTVEYVGQDRRLALLSDHTPGRRLSEVLAHARDPVFAASLIRQLTPALHALNDYDDGVGHGALTASRIVSAADGTLIIVEHVLGSAVERLHLTAAAIRRDLGIAMPGTDTGYPRADGPTDCFQLALVAISMLLGRPLRSDEYADLAGALNAALPAPGAESVEQVSGLRTWLERALQLQRGFLSSGEADAALREMAVLDPEDTARRWRALREAPQLPNGGGLASNDAVWQASPMAETPNVLPAESSSHPVDAPPLEISDAAPYEPVAPQVAVPFLTQRYGRNYLRWALPVVALCAIVEALVIAMLLAGRGPVTAPPAAAQVSVVTNDPGAPVMVDGRLAGVTPLDLSIDSEVRSIRVGSSLTPPPKQEMVVGSTGQETTRLETDRAYVGADSRPRTAAAPPDRAGGIRISTPIELDVFEGDRRLGSTATGIVPVAAGRHEFDLVNSVVGFRLRQVVDVRAGQVAALTVSPPNGRININAVPWADVLIDGKPVGETPIGNLSIPLGEHEIIFRHPQLGEMRRAAVVRSDAVTRVSANLER